MRALPANKLSKNNSYDSSIVKKVAGENPAREATLQWVAHQPQHGSENFIFRQALRKFISECYYHNDSFKWIEYR